MRRNERGTTPGMPSRYRELSSSMRARAARAWLGGSFAAGHATESSDVDVYAVSYSRDYELLWNSREMLVEAR